MKVKDLEILENVIKSILEENADARSDDMFLYYCYLIRKGIRQLELVFLNPRYRKMNKIANFASVERARRKLQAKYPALANEETKKARAKEEENYKEYARE